ncbi:hypothetical protein MLD38_028854 [Melastoma candidum]|uniref:Uncharacterized protein n=1 Tax=Melastoma candidum TaxID=119954 RepID=A0ACB9N2A8_9MYRT|nr:hypothetical protein MLD38_028854 [Melastoma candidum]
MSSATQTLCGQAFGAKQYHMLGIYLQRSPVVNLIVATALLPMFPFARPIFALLGEDDDIVEAVCYIAPWFIPHNLLNSVQLIIPAVLAISVKEPNCQFPLRILTHDSPVLVVALHICSRSGDPGCNECDHNLHLAKDAAMSSIFRHRSQLGNLDQHWTLLLDSVSRPRT